jgi:hypothetical protein
VSFRLTLLFALSGCVDLGDEVAALLPDKRVEVDFPGASSAARTTTPAAWYSFTAQLSQDLNGLAGSVPALVGDIVAQLPSRAAQGSDDTRAWGPYTAESGATETELTVSQADYSAGYTWMFSQWPAGDPDQTVPVVEGEIDAGATSAASSGRFAIDFATMAALDAGLPVPIGVMHIEYSFAAAEDAVRVDLLDVDGTGVDAAYEFVDVYGEGGQLHLGLQSDLLDPYEGGLREATALAAQWTDAGAGRTDVVVSGGDLGSAQLVVSECWDATFAAVWTDDGNGTIVGVEGDCAFAALEPEAPQG